jgi:hypothetical protein
MALAIPVRAADHNPDADLIAACAEYSELARRHEALFDNIENETADEETAREEAQEPIHNAMLATVERIQGLPPVATFEGVRAIVRAVTIWDTDVLGGYNLSNTSVDLMDVLFESLAGDLVRGAA